MKPTRRITLIALVIAIAAIPVALWMRDSPRIDSTPATPPPIHNDPPPPPAHSPTAAERLLEGYADPTSPPLEDLRKIHRVVTGYFSTVKDASRFPIGGNADLAAALRGENPNREIYIPDTHPIFSKDGLLIDRWGSPLIIHPEAWMQIELRSAGPDKVSYTTDDVVLTP